MRWSVRYLALFFLGVSAAVADGAAPPRPFDQARLEALVRQLDDDSYQVREQAERELGKYGAWAIPLLRQKQATATSLEARRRLGRALDRMRPSSVKEERGKELAARFAQWTSGSLKDKREAADWFGKLSAEDRRLLRQAVPTIPDPVRRRDLVAIFEYLDRLERRADK